MKNPDPKRTKQERDMSLVGKYFASFDHGHGQIKARVEDGVYLLGYDPEDDGMPLPQTLVAVQEMLGKDKDGMENFIFFDTAEERVRYLADPEEEKAA